MQYAELAFSIYEEYYVSAACHYSDVWRSIHTSCLHKKVTAVYLSSAAPPVAMRPGWICEVMCEAAAAGDECRNGCQHAILQRHEMHLHEPLTLQTP